MPEPTSLADIILAINARLPAEVNKRFGSEFLAEAVAPPRVVWVPERDTFGPPGRHGSPATGISLGGARTFMTRIQQVAVHIKAAGADDSEDEYKHLRALDVLVNRVIVAIYEVARGSVTVDDGEHVPIQVTGHARSYMLHVSFRIPVIRHPDDDTDTTAPISETAQLGIMGDSEGRPAP
jgi:hypothetical protein